MFTDSKSRGFAVLQIAAKEGYVNLHLVMWCCGLCDLHLFMTHVIPLPFPVPRYSNIQWNKKGSAKEICLEY